MYRNDYGYPETQAPYAGSELEQKAAYYARSLPLTGHYDNTLYVSTFNVSNLPIDTPFVSTQDVSIPYSTAYASSYDVNTHAELQPVFFLNPQGPITLFVDDAVQIEQTIKDTFFHTAGTDMPGDISITVADRRTLLKSNSAFLNNSVVGVSINSGRQILVVSGSMAEVMLTIGHEIGHVLTLPAKTSKDEEAKAFAFESAWAQAIFENNIAGLASSIDAAKLEPAKNRLHNLAFDFVKNRISELNPLQLFRKISRGEISFEPVQYAKPNSARPRIYGGYLNKSRVQNLAPLHNFFWSDLGKGIYGMYAPLTRIETINERLLRSDIEQLHRTLGHEYSLHHVMGLPDGYEAEALEDAMFWLGESDDRYYPRKE